MDVSAIRLSVLTMDNGRQRRLSNSHLWADATELIMNLSEIRPLFKYVSAGCPGCTRPRRIMWRQEPFSHLNRLLNPLFFSTFCEDFDSHGGSGTFLSNYAERNRKNELRFSDCWCYRIQTMKEKVKNHHELWNHLVNNVLTQCFWVFFFIFLKYKVGRLSVKSV